MRCLEKGRTSSRLRMIAEYFSAPRELNMDRSPRQDSDWATSMVMLTMNGSLGC